jgi:hypothetical protein
MFWGVYHRDPDDCTECEFYAMLARIPAPVREAWGYGGDTLVEEAERAERMETIIALAFPAGQP